MMRASLIMACIAATAAVGGAAILALPAHSEGAAYGKRIAGTMCLAAGLILGLFAWGLERAGG